MQRRRGQYAQERRHLSSTVVLCSSVAAAGIVNAGVFSRDRGRGRQKEGQRQKERHRPFGA